MLGPAKGRALDRPALVSLEALVPADHCYRQLDRTLDLSFVRDLGSGAIPTRSASAAGSRAAARSRARSAATGAPRRGARTRNRRGPRTYTR